MLKKSDIILLASLLGVAAAAFVVLKIFSPAAGNTVTVKQDNEVVYEGELNDDNVVELGGNTVIIKDGEAYMMEADCKNQICVSHKEISKNGESIVCLPNRVIVEITRE